MSQASLPLQQLCQTAIAAAEAAGHYIQSADRAQIQREYKNAGGSSASQLVTEVDRHSEDLIRQCLDESCTRWRIAFVGEESSLESADALPDRFTSPLFWCVDPLDGTLPFMEGTHGYAVSIALVEQSGIPLIGVVYDPVDNTLLHAVRGQGVFRNGAAMHSLGAPSNNLMVFADASFRTHDSRDYVIDVLTDCALRSGLDGIELIYGNGAVKNACRVLDYSHACYLKLPKVEVGGGSIWDFAATACIFNEANGWVSNIFGEALDLNRRDSTFMNHQGVLYASSEKMALSLVAGFSSA
jgi:fructose-1,6-bisphosphatase/inositol monophosphatase family enzyme